MATFSSIQARVTARLIDMPAAIVTEIPLLINDAYRDLQLKHNFKVMEALLQANTTVGSQTLVALPANLKQWRAKPFYVTDTGYPYELVWAPNIAALNGTFGYLDVGSPRALRIPEEGTDGAGTIEVWPIPDGDSDYTDGEYRVNIPYIKYLAALSNPTDTSWLVDEGELWLTYEAVAQGFANNWDEQRSTYWTAKAQAEYNDIKKADKEMRLSMMQEFVPFRGAKGPHMSF